jgi:hypothetical protein
MRGLVLARPFPSPSALLPYTVWTSLRSSNPTASFCLIPMAAYVGMAQLSSAEMRGLSAPTDGNHFPP